jgi:GntR family transcriptional regulator
VNSTAHTQLRADQRPLYVQAAEALRKLVHQGGYAPGDRLPSEVELSQRLGISRPTLREALHQLEEEGAILRRHGVGTFVAEPKPVLDAGLEVLESLDRMAERGGLKTSMGAANIEARLATEREIEGLEAAAGTVVTAVTRVIVADGREVAYLIDIVPDEYLIPAELENSAPAEQPVFHGSVLDYLLQRGWPALSHSRTELSVEAADLELARALSVARGAPLLRLEAQLFAQDGRIVDYSISHFVPGHFRFHVVRRVG